MSDTEKKGKLPIAFSLVGDDIPDALSCLSHLTALASEYAGGRDETRSETGMSGLSFLLTMITGDLKLLSEISDRLFIALDYCENIRKKEKTSCN